MRFDDRISTVLRLPTGGRTVARAQFRQLIDLLGTMPAEAHGPGIDAGFDRLAELSRTIPATERAGIVADPGLRLRSPRLVAFLAEAEPQVAEAAIRAARLDEDQWLDLVPALPVQARGRLRLRRDLGPRTTEQLARLGINNRGLPAPETSASAAAAEPEPAPLPPASEGIGALVKRIEAYRRAREGGSRPHTAEAPLLPLGEALSTPPRQTRAFDFATDAEGRVVWADPGVAPMTIGLRLDGSRALTAALRMRQPMRGLALELFGSPAIAGDWIIDAAPAFDSMTGRFTGYEGRLRRPPSPDLPLAAARPVAESEADRMRQLLHELRTPVNAIQGFAEVIQQQLFGPTPHEYRAHAAAIASDAARILAGFEELERFARLDSGAMTLDSGEADFAEAVRATARQLGPPLASRNAALVLREDGEEELAVSLAPIECQRLAWRLLATMAAHAAPGEELRARLRRKGGEVRLTLHLPASLASRQDEDLFHATAPQGGQALSTGMFGTGFALRLARAEARAAGGRLERRGERLRLSLPGLTRGKADHSEAAGASHAP